MTKLATLLHFYTFTVTGQVQILLAKHFNILFTTIRSKEARYLELENIFREIEMSILVRDLFLNDP